MNGEKEKKKTNAMGGGGGGALKKSIKRKLSFVIQARSRGRQPFTTQLYLFLCPPYLSGP